MRVPISMLAQSLVAQRFFDNEPLTLTLSPRKCGERETPGKLPLPLQEKNRRQLDSLALRLVRIIASGTATMLMMMAFTGIQTGPRRTGGADEAAHSSCSGGL